jgi:hypothetical protein
MRLDELLSAAILPSGHRALGCGTGEHDRA